MLALLFMTTLAIPAMAQGNGNDTPSDPAALVRDGDFYMDRGDCSLAQYFYAEALDADPAHVGALVGRGRAMRCQGALSASVDALRQAVDLSGDDADPLVQLALTYREQYLSDPNAYGSRLADALDAVTRAERSEPDAPKVLNTLGLIRYQAGDLEQARSSFERAAERADATEGLSDREHSTIRVNLGRVYRDLDELDLASRTFRRAVVADPTNPDAHNLLGNVLYRMGRCDEAQYELQQAVTLAPRSLSSVSQLGIALFECDDVHGAIPYLERALDLEGAVFTPPLYTYLAQAYLEVGRVDDAVRRAQQGALLPPERAEAHVVLGRAYEARGADGDSDAARSAYRKALELRPGYGDAQRALDALN
ncbi:MAG: tetratricopeptide repeat protein [Trueperaceae bacterium]